MKRTFKDMKEKETSYNPITQKFKDPVIEQHIERVEKDSFIDVLAKNKDRALRYEQTFNVVNFENKLKGLEDRVDYPKERPWYFRPRAETNAEYNILSNHPLTEHHYAAPEVRPIPKEEKVRLREEFNDGIEIKSKEDDHYWAQRLQHNQRAVLGVTRRQIESGPRNSASGSCLQILAIAQL